MMIASLAWACANAPQDELRQAEAAYRAAEEVGAAKHPASAYHLALAKDQIAAARLQMDEGHDEAIEARQLLERAELDAELAIALAKTRAAEARAEEAWVEVQELKNQSRAGGTNTSGVGSERP